MIGRETVAIDATDPEAFRFNGICAVIVVAAEDLIWCIRADATAADGCVAVNAVDPAALI